MRASNLSDRPELHGADLHREASLNVNEKSPPHETSICDTAETGEVLDLVDYKRLLFKIDCRLMPLLRVPYLCGE